MSSSMTFGSTVAKATSEIPAKGIKGFLLYNPSAEDKYFFRVYDANDKSKFQDYELACEEIPVEITGDWVSLYNNEKPDQRDAKRSWLGWASKIFDRANNHAQAPKNKK